MNGSAASNIIVFVGPSLPPSDRRRFGPAVDWRPPVGRGDLDDLGDADLTVVLVDGYLVHRHPPSPTEVFRLVQRGVTVWGCSSLGALRAAELRHHRVSGSGWVFDRVVDGTITADDELVAELDPRTNLACGVFLANLRFGLDVYLDAGHITECQRDDLLRRVGEWHFAARTVDAVRGAALSVGLESPTIDALLNMDVKRADAVRLIGQLTALART